MKMLRLLIAGWVSFCLATLFAEAGLAGVLWLRGQLSAQTLENLLIVAYDIPVAEIYEKLQAQTQPAEKEMVSLAEVRDARTLAALDLELRELAADKGLANLRELDSLAEVEKDRYTLMKEEFDSRWELLRQGALDNELQELSRKIESVPAKLAKDQLLRILDDEKLDENRALQQVVSILRSMPAEKRKKIMVEFKDQDRDRMLKLLGEIRRGMPQAALIDETRKRLDQLQREQ